MYYITKSQKLPGALPPGPPPGLCHGSIGGVTAAPKPPAENVVPPKNSGYVTADVFVLLTVYVFWQGCKSKVLIKTFDTTWSLIDTDETAKKHVKIVPSLIGAHALSGCDSVPKLYGIGKKTVIEHLKDQNLSLSNLGDTAASLANVYAKSTKLISSCYGVKDANNLSEV